MAGSILTKIFDRNSRIAVIEINDSSSGANVLNKTFFSELNALLDLAEKDTALNGIVFTTGKKNIFLAGADLVTLHKNLDNEKELGELVEEGQDTFTRIKKLKVPTVAAIHGVCVGGGLEFALACDVRVASNDSSTKIGLPEVMLGILPAWGGCTRLPRLIGLVNALKVILSGTPKPSNYCKKIGIVDKVVHKENLVTTAISSCKYIKRNLPKNKPLINWFIFNRARSTAIAKTVGNYPAPLMIIDMISKGIGLSEQKSLILERGAFLQLAKTDACRNLIRVFFLQEKSKKLIPPGIHPELKKTAMCHPIKNVAVIGAGTMGAGIAQWFASKGLNVLLKDINSIQIGNGLQTIGDLFIDGVLGHKFNRSFARVGMSHITTGVDISIKNKDLVLEVIAENFNLKVKVLSEIENTCNDDTIIATNTSALSITDISKALKRPENFIGIHFFNPPHKMKLVEVVVGQATSAQTVGRVVEFVKSIGKLPVVVKDSPGFLVNRILLPYLVGAIRLVMRGNDIKKIDSAMVKFGMPMGPLRLLDEIGLDVGIHVALDLGKRLSDFNIPTDMLKTILAIGHYGKKTGAGFYTYGKNKAINRELQSAVQTTRDILTEDKIIDFLVQLMTDEATKCLQEGIVKDSDDIDFAMIMGTGWAPFRGGPMTYGD